MDITPADEIEQMRKNGMPPFWVDALANLTQYLLSGDAGYTTDTMQRITGNPARAYEQWSRAQLGAFQ